VSDTNLIPEAPLSPDAERPARRHGRTVLAGLLAIAVVAGGVAVLGGGGSSKRHLPVLALGSLGRSAAATDRAAEPGVLMPYRPLRYVHDGAWPALADHATVRQLRGPTLDADSVSRVAHAFGIDATPERGANGWTVTDGNVSMQIDTSGPVPMISVYDVVRGGSSSGSGGSGSGSVSGGAPDAGSGSDATIPPSPTTNLPAMPVPTNQTPTDLPSDDEAAARARQILDAAGVLDGEWRTEVSDGGTAIATPACPPNAMCATPDVLLAATTRSVAFHRVIDGHDVAGLDWYVEIGDHARLLGASGPLGTLESVGDYPLRSIDAAFADVQAGRDSLGGGKVQPLSASGIASDTPTKAPTDSAPDTPIDTPTSAPTSTPPTAKVTDVSIELVVTDGTADGRTGRFVVPVYRFHASTASGGVTADVTADAAALADRFLAAPEPVPVPETGLTHGGNTDPGGPPEIAPGSGVATTPLPSIDTVEPKPSAP
jgi:hypothetical protein